MSEKRKELDLALRFPKYLSPSALACWEKNPDEYFMRYNVPKCIRPDKPPQTDPMSVGSAFDALAKNYIGTKLWGYDNLEEFHLSTLVRAQCEEHTLPESLVIACDLFDQYERCGALGNLMAEINNSSQPPQMEFDVTATIGGVPLLGKPDLHFHTIMHSHVITDWKVSGSVSKHGVSPQQGYQLALDCHGSATQGKSHKKYVPVLHGGGVFVNEVPMNVTTDYWADQLSTYAWALGEEVGSQRFICRIEQLACRTTKGQLRAKCVVHQSTVDRHYQEALLGRYQRCWDHVTRNHIWADLSVEQSQARGDLMIRQLTQPADPTKMSTGTIPEINWN